MIALSGQEIESISDPYSWQPSGFKFSHEMASVHLSHLIMFLYTIQDSPPHKLIMRLNTFKMQQKEFLWKA